MKNVTFYFSALDSVLSSLPIIFIIFTASSILKILLFSFLSRRNIESSKIKKPFILLLIVLFSAILHDLSWVLYSIQHWLLANIDNRLFSFFYRIIWSVFFIQQLSLSLLIDNLTQVGKKLNSRQKFFIFITGLLSIFIISLAILDIMSGLISINISFKQLEMIILKIAAIYCIFILILSSIISYSKIIRTPHLPRILIKQVKILINFLVIPYCILEFIENFPFDFSITWINNSFTLLNISNIILTSFFYFCTRKIMGLRFLNFTNHVQSPIKHNFMDGLKATLEQLGHVTNLQELRHITQSFFKEAFNIPLNRTHLFIRNTNKQDYLDGNNKISTLVETFMITHEQHNCDLMLNSKIFIYDELAFSNFYSELDDGKSTLSFLEEINADIFLPIYEKNSLIAYIMVDRFARIQEFYSDVERDEMLVFSSYLGNIINLLQNRNFDILLAKEKDLEEELYHKHQEINQYKESIRSFVRNSKEHDIGIIFYKHRRFIFGNQAAKELINVNINIQAGHPIAKALKQIAQHVEQYKTPQSTLAKDAKDNTIVLSAVPHLDQNNVIITVYYPRVADILKKQVDLHHDPTEWDYLLYLETTRSGKLINQLIPGAGEQLLRFKINLLKLALSKKAILLDMAEEDVMPTVELLHHISLRETLHVLNLEPGSINKLDLAIKLFGINPIFGHTIQERPLLEKLDQNGTLFIKNIHVLDLELQEYLAEFIRYGFYRIYKSEHKEPSDVRIICSLNQDLQVLVREGKFSEQLFNELNRTTLTMPSLFTLPEHELKTLAEGFSEQAIQTQAFQNLLSLTTKDKNKLTTQRPASLQELKIKVQQLLVQKSKQNEILHDIQFDPAYQVSDPDLVQVARLGKHALKDRKMMMLLWEKFKNQNKIAEFLGVNRSSVNRRCKEYNLH